ncbi:hypothetical protein H4582DRAFT_1948725 [Lactarius indigo]|nr:hypothetical protein H4582DRAFT_1948725 [Lactarius indigo]
MSVLPHHRSPHFPRTNYPLRLLHAVGRIVGVRTADDTLRDVTVTQSIPHPPNDGHVPDDLYAHGDLAIYDLCKRMRHLVSTCDNFSVFTNQELWLRRARGCVETAASLVLCANIQPDLFGDLGKLLRSLHQFTGQYHTTPGSDGLFVARWTCLSLVIVQKGVLGDHERIQLEARAAIDNLSRFGLEDDGEQTNNGDNDETALRNARRIDDIFETATQFCLYGLRGAFRPAQEGVTEEQVKEALARDHKDDISMLERITPAADRIANIDGAILRTNGPICTFANGLILCVRGAHFDEFKQAEPADPTGFFGSTGPKPVFLPQFIFLHQRLRPLCSYSSKLREIIDGRGNGAYQDILKSLGILWGESDNPTKWSGVGRRHLMERQLWRLQDLRDGGGFGYWVELFFLMTQQLLTVPLSPDSHAALIVGTFRAMTSNRWQHNYSIGTQRVILNLICDMAILNRGLFSDLVFPKYITDELLELFENMVRGRSGSHIDDAAKELDDAVATDVVRGPEWWTTVRLFRADAVKVLSRLRAPAPSP